VENLEVIRSATSDGSSRRFSLCSCCHDPFDFIEYYSVQMVRRYESIAIYAVSHCAEVISKKPWKRFLKPLPSTNFIIVKT
jgi:hypothetical protein